jgi:hypothetical protein
VVDSVRIVSWNMHQNPDAWTRLKEIQRVHGAQVALVQEAVPPSGAGDWRCHPAPSQTDQWRIAAHSDVQRRFASAVVVLDSALDLEPVQPTPLGLAEYGKFAVSHPGQFSVAEIGLPSGERFTAISLYGIWDRDERYLFSEATLHRAISDLTMLLQEKARANVVLGGDLNIFFEWDRASKDAYWAPR